MRLTTIAVAFSRPAEAEEKHHPARRATRRFARQNGAVSSKPAKVRELSHGIFRNSQAHWGRSPTVAEGGGVSAANVAGLQDLGRSCTEKLPRAKALQFLCLTCALNHRFRQVIKKRCLKKHHPKSQHGLVCKPAVCPVVLFRDRMVPNCLILFLFSDLWRHRGWSIVDAPRRFCTRT